MNEYNMLTVKWPYIYGAVGSFWLAQEDVLVIYQ